MPIPDKIVELIERFERNKKDYKSGGYNEAQVRKEFIDPFFEALGWDVNNSKGYAEAYKDVIHEDSIKIGKNPEAPDYCFRVGGTRKFFLEAKKPSIDVKNDPHPAYQLRRYAWSSKLPLSILTDFEEFAYYDCRVKPVNGDKSTTARLMYYTYDQYPDAWDEISSIFSRDAVLKGSFDRYASTTKGKRGSAEVDTAFLKEIESWRELLAKNIALRNPELTRRALNFSVQRTIDRIIFLRICEDRSIEEYQTLMALLNGKNVYPRLCETFQRADHRYNSGLFHFTHEKGEAEAPDELSLNLNIDDKPLKDIIRRLYYPESPYEFSVLPADILGQVYEQFLGKVIRLTDGHQAKVEDKPEVKKAGGVFYTPTYIVDYIVENTVGKLLEGKTPNQVSKLKILDPACGSGSFLIGAYQYLLDWHLKYYSENPEKWLKGRKPPLVQLSDKDYRLTTDERKRILLNNIFGVDIDSQAVEVTKLSLLLKVLEGETRQNVDSYFKLFHERVLPDLGANIKCGNSLIAPDFYIGKQINIFDEEERYRINVFDWKKEFPAVFEAGGFDAVIGNPPYIVLEGDFRDNEQTEYFKIHYNCATYKIDTYHLFIEKCLKLLKEQGICSLITPSNFLTNNYLLPLRKFMVENGAIDRIVIIDQGIFVNASVDNAIIILHKLKKPPTSFALINAISDNDKLKINNSINVQINDVISNEFYLFIGTTKYSKIWSRITEESIPLESISHINFGKQLRNRKQFKQDVIGDTSTIPEPKKYKRCYTGENIFRYYTKWNGIHCLDDREAQRGGCWNDERQNAVNKILTKQIGKYPVYALDLNGYQCLNTIFMINIYDPEYNPYYILGILNSKILNLFWVDNYYDKRRTFPKIKGTYLSKLPIHPITKSSPTDVARHDRMVELVTAMLDLHKQLAAARTGDDKAAIQRVIDATDREIDRLVYDLYELTDEEIGIVEAG